MTTFPFLTSIPDHQCILMFLTVGNFIFIFIFKHKQIFFYSVEKICRVFADTDNFSFPQHPDFIEVKLVVKIRVRFAWSWRLSLVPTICLTLSFIAGGQPVSAKFSPIHISLLSTGSLVGCSPSKCLWLVLSVFQSLNHYQFLHDE